ncbi:MAG: glutaredoxin family protein [Actinobacteria bacterium]|nr:MAG: glutaredoxin family protein [Actinomycetota bacterium]
MASRIVFYTKPGCHLCDDARGLLEAWAVPYEVVESDPRYELRVPVVELDGAVIAEAPIDERALARALGVRRRNSV